MAAHVEREAGEDRDVRAAIPRCVEAGDPAADVIAQPLTDRPSVVEVTADADDRELRNELAWEERQRHVGGT